MTLAVDPRALHFEHRHQCCRIVGDDYEQCGLWCGHDGEHLPHVGYMAPPIISPLWVLWFDQWRMAGAWVLVHCPLCGARPSTVECEPETLTYRVWGDFEQTMLESVWRFEPCGCEGREILPQHGVNSSWRCAR